VFLVVVKVGHFSHESTGGAVLHVGPVGGVKKAITPQRGEGAKIIILFEMCFSFLRGALGGDGGVWDPTGSTVSHTSQPQFLKSGTPMTIGKV